VRRPNGPVTHLVDVDHLVIGAGASGMASTDALIDHAPDVRVALVDRRDGVGGHWREAYPFVQLHQASTYYGVASTLLGEGRRQSDGPEAGLHERADQPTILAYHDQVLRDRMLATGRVQLFARCDYLGGRTFVSRDSGERYEVPERCRVVDRATCRPASPRRPRRRSTSTVPTSSRPTSCRAPAPRPSTWSSARARPPPTASSGS